ALLELPGGSRSGRLFQDDQSFVELARGRCHMSAIDGLAAHELAPSTDGPVSRGRSRSVFNIEGMRCANCALAVERAVNGLNGVRRISVNAATARASVEWDPEQVALPTILGTISKAGFKPVPFEGEEAAAAERSERRAALKRIGIAGLGMMQTMMFVYALYAGGNHGVNAEIAQYLRLAGMLLTTPVLVYSGAPFFSAAMRDLRQRRLGM